MTNNILRADVTEVAIGSLRIEGLMDENGCFHVGIPQVVGLDLIPPNRSQKQLESLVGMSFQSHRKLKTSLHPKAINAISLKDFEILLAKLDRSGNVLAQQFRDDLVGLSLHQLFSDSFGIKFDADDRQAWLSERMSGKVARRSLTDSVKDYILRHPELSENAIQWMYGNVSNATYRSIFGRSCKKLEADLQVERHKLRDALTVKELNHLNAFEDLATRLIDEHGYNPTDAVHEAEKRLLIKKHDRVAA